MKGIKSSIASLRVALELSVFGDEGPRGGENSLNEEVFALRAVDGSSG